MRKDHKSQITNHKQIANSNFQNTKQISSSHWNFGHWRLFVIWRLALGISILAGCGEKIVEVKKAIIPVEVAVVQEKELQEILKFTGDIEGKDQVQVYPKVTGKLIEYKVQEGAPIEKQDVIALIDRDVTGFKFEPAPVEAPIAGIVAKTYLDRGGSVNPQTPIAVIADMDEVKIKIEVTEVDYPKVKKGQSARVAVDAYPDKEFTGILFRFSALIDPNTRTATAEIIIPNPQHLLVPGMFARISLLVGEHKALVVPRDAILRLPGTGVYYCFTVEGNQAKKALIELGIKENNDQEIKQGLKEGDLVILSGQGILQTGVSVEVHPVRNLTDKDINPVSNGVKKNVEGETE